VSLPFFLQLGCLFARSLTIVRRFDRISIVLVLRLSPVELVKRVVQHLAADKPKRYGATVFARAEQHTPQSLIDELKKEIFVPERKACLLLAVGGGSAIGVAKALALQAPSGVGMLLQIEIFVCLVVCLFCGLGLNSSCLCSFELRFFHSSCHHHIFFFCVSAHVAVID
jgi:hypothetical protein